MRSFSRRNSRMADPRDRPAPYQRVWHTIRPMLILQVPPVPPVPAHHWGAAQWGTVAQWVGAVVTAVAIGVALFKESIIRWLRHPELTARLEARHPDCVKTPLKHGEWWGSRYFLRLWIRNEGDVRAEKVEVFLARAWVEHKVGSWEELPQFTPMNLRWSNGDWKNPTIYVDGISPGMSRYCDLGAISDPAHPDLKSLPEAGKTRLGLQFEFLGPASEYLLPGKYKFEILVAASNREPVAYFVEIHLTGLWSEDEKEMFKNGFTVTVRKG